MRQTNKVERRETEQAKKRLRATRRKTAKTSTIDKMGTKPVPRALDQQVVEWQLAGQGFGQPVLRVLADQDQGSVKRPKQPDLARQAQPSRRRKKSSKSFGDVKDNLKNILDHDAERVTWQKREKIPENES